MEKTLDQMENAVESEKRAKANVEKERRKLEGDLKLAQVINGTSSIVLVFINVDFRLGNCG